MSKESYQSKGAQRPTTTIIDEEMQDDSSSSNSIDIVNTVLQNNVQESPKLGLDPSRRSQRIERQSSRLLISFTRKKITTANCSNHSSHPMPKDKQLPNATLQNLHKSDHNTRFTKIIKANFGSATPSTTNVTQMLRANTLNGELMDEASPLPRPQTHLSRTSPTQLIVSGKESIAESNGRSTNTLNGGLTSKSKSVTESNGKINVFLHVVDHKLQG
jgi:hypothetical protein